MANKYSFTIYSDPRFINNSGYSGTHTWIVVSDGTEAGTKKYSYGPSDNLLGSPGKFENPNTLYSEENGSSNQLRTENSPQYKGSISEAQYNAMITKGNDLVNDPPYYQVVQSGGDNCVEVTSMILEAGGINFAKDLWFLVT